jgi:hypothetical protein
MVAVPIKQINAPIESHLLDACFQQVKAWLALWAGVLLLKSDKLLTSL